MRLAIVFVLAACAGKGPTPTDEGNGAVRDPRTPIEKRRDAACDKIAERVTGCAVAEAKANFAAGKIPKGQLDKDTAPDVTAKNTEVYASKCKAPSLSSRQVRVLEVCYHEETECEPFLSCLENLKPQ
jgi:hypothetical protein